MSKDGQVIPRPAQGQSSKLDVRQYFANAKEKYASASQYTNVLLYGDMGTGKTHTLGTAPAPLLVHSFDPGGTNTLKSMVRGGVVKEDMLLIQSFEDEDMYAPKAFEAWNQELNYLRANNVFESIGTFCIDSGTYWMDAVFNYLLKTDGRAGQVPQLSDYNKFQLMVSNMVRVMTSLPCHFIMTGHVSTMQDETTGRVQTGIFSPGQLVRVKLPLMFDEVLLTETIDTPKGIEYKLRTASRGNKRARTRIGGEGLFAELMEPNLREMFRLAGKLSEDKPSIW